MFGYFLLLPVVLVQARPKNIMDEMLNGVIENDANLNPGFDIQAFRIDQLNLHNYYRSLHGVPLMTLDADLVSKAQEYAETLAANNAGLDHCELPSCDPEGAGENLANASRSIRRETNATKNWYEEVYDYNYCHEEKNFNRPGHEGKAIGHFTQVVWKTSTKLGIGYAQTADRKTVYVVGRYKDHGNVKGRYAENVPMANYLLNIFQDNCAGTNGGLSAWSEAGECSRSCGGGVRFKHRTCTNPKPSLNGRDCTGQTKQLAAQEWCNNESCADETNHRDQQCAARGWPAKSHNFGGGSDCKLHCFRSGRTYMRVGDVDDGTHCASGSGVCVDGKCRSMPPYVAPTQRPPTNAAGAITGSYTGTPAASVWDNLIWSVPNGATNVLITNNDYNTVGIYVGYTFGRYKGWRWYEQWYKNIKAPTTFTVLGVTFQYERKSGYSTIKIPGPIQPKSGYTFVLFVSGNGQADITWSYNAATITA